MKFTFRKLSLFALALVALFVVAKATDFPGLMTVGQLAVTADSQGTGNAVIGGTLTVTGATTLSSSVASLISVVTYNTTTTARTITATEAKCRTTFVVASSSDDPVTFNLPVAVAGMEVTFIDNDATAAADLTINPVDGTTINGGSAGVSYNCTGDAVAQVTVLRAISTTEWVSVSTLGTWAAGS